MSTPVGGFDAWVSELMGQAFRPADERASPWKQPGWSKPEVKASPWAKSLARGLRPSASLLPFWRLGLPAAEFAFEVFPFSYSDEAGYEVHPGDWRILYTFPSCTALEECFTNVYGRPPTSDEEEAISSHPTNKFYSMQPMPDAAAEAGQGWHGRPELAPASGRYRQVLTYSWRARSGVYPAIAWDTREVMEDGGGRPPEVVEYPPGLRRWPWPNVEYPEWLRRWPFGDPTHPWYNPLAPPWLKLAPDALPRDLIPWRRPMDGLAPQESTQRGPFHPDGVPRPGREPAPRPEAFPRPKPKPVAKPGTAPKPVPGRPGTQPEPEAPGVPEEPDRPLEPDRPPEPDRPTKPRPGDEPPNPPKPPGTGPGGKVPEKKVGGKAGTFIRKAFSNLTEISDFVDCLYEGVPPSRRLKYRPGKPILLHEKFMVAVANVHRDDYDVLGFLKCVVANEIEDQIIGKGFKAASEQLREIRGKGLPGGFWNPAAKGVSFGGLKVSS